MSKDMYDWLIEIQTKLAYPQPDGPGLVYCVGNGRPGRGCGRVEGGDSGVCPMCGGTVLSLFELAQREREGL